MTVDTEEYILTTEEKDMISEFMSYPKINILNGKMIQMTRTGWSVNIIDEADKYPDLLTLESIDSSIEFNEDSDNNNHPFDLGISDIITAYYLHNEIPFSLDRK